MLLFLLSIDSGPGANCSGCLNRLTSPWIGNRQFVDSLKLFGTYVAVATYKLVCYDIIKVYEMTKYFSQLRNFRVFENISADQLPVMLECLKAMIKEFRKSEFIYLEGDKLDQIGVLIQGTVHMIKEDIWGNKAIMDTIKSGDLFGESIVCGEVDSSSFSFQAASDCTVLFFNFHKVLRACNNSCEFHQRFIENMVKVIAQKNVLMLNKMEIISKKTIRNRLLTWISQQVRLNGSKCFASPMGRLELADYLCVDRSALTRELTKMKKDGLIDFNKTMYCLTADFSERYR